MDTQAITAEFVDAYADRLFADRRCGGATLDQMARLWKARAAAEAALDSQSFDRAVFRASNVG
jgi:hypothetical protein